MSDGPVSFYIDVSHHDWNRLRGDLDWARVKGSGIQAVCIRASYGDPVIYNPATFHFGDMARGAAGAGLLVGGYHNLIRGDQDSINRQVAYFQGELAGVGATWAMLDVEPYQALVTNGLWPRWEDVLRFAARWQATGNGLPLTLYVARWVWSGWLGSPDMGSLAPDTFPLVSARYVQGAGTPSALYQAADQAAGWARYGNREPAVWQLSSTAVIPGASATTDVNVFRGTSAQFATLVTGKGTGGVTDAPASLLASRKFMITRFNIDPLSVGIVGDASHIGGYHHGWAQRRVTSTGALNDYSWEESSRDYNFKSQWARGIDVGWFDVTINGRRITMLDFNRWLVAECQKNAPDTRWIREVIYTLDRRTVRRWDRLGIRSNGDLSHTSHTHISAFADTVTRPNIGMFQRFYNEATGEDEMSAWVEQQSAAVSHMLPRFPVSQTSDDGKEVPFTKALKEILEGVRELRGTVTTAPGVTDEQASAMADKIGARLLEALSTALPDRPLSEEDKATVLALVKQAAREGSEVA